MRANSATATHTGTGGGIRDGAWVAEAAGLVGMRSRPPETQLILRTGRNRRRRST
jgi:hypothetical protein